MGLGTLPVLTRLGEGQMFSFNKYAKSENKELHFLL